MSYADNVLMIMALNPRGSAHLTPNTRHGQGPHEPLGYIYSLMSGTDDHKPADSKDAYSYYTGTLYEGSQDPRQPVEMFSQLRYLLFPGPSLRY